VGESTSSLLGTFDFIRLSKLVTLVDYGLDSILRVILLALLLDKA